MKERSSHNKVRVLQEPRQPLLPRLCQMGITALVLAVLVFVPLAFGGLPNWSLAIAETIVWLAAALWLVNILIQRDVKIVVSPMLAPVLMLACYVVVRYAATEVESLARREMTLVLTTTLLFLVVLNNLNRRWQLVWLVACWTIVGTLLAGYGIWQWISQQPHVWWMPQPLAYTGHASGTFLRPSHFAAYLVATFSITVAFFFFARWDMRAKICLSLAGLLMASGILLSFSVPAWAGVLAAVLVLGSNLMGKRRYRARWLVLGSALWIALTVGALIALQARQMTGNEPPRLPMWVSAWNIGLQHPLVGSGPGMFPWLYPTQRALQGGVDRVGNEYLNVFADYGAVGVILLAWVWASFAYSAVQILRSRVARYSINNLSNRYAMVVGALAAAAGAAVQATMDFNLYVPANLFALAALAACAMTCGTHPAGRSHGEEPVPGQFVSIPVKGWSRLGLTISLLFLLVLHAVGLCKTAPADLHLHWATVARDELRWNDAQYHLEQAWHYDPQSYYVANAAGDLYLARATWNGAARDQYQAQALRWFERADMRNPHAGDVGIKIGRILDVQGRRSEAADRYARAIEFDPQNASYHAQLGLHHQRWGDEDKAIASFRKAYELGGPDALPEVALTERGLL